MENNPPQQIQPHYMQHNNLSFSNSNDHKQYVWSHAYRECALYNSSVKSQIDRENKIFNRDYSQGKPKKFVNIFKGLDNSDPWDFDALKD